MLLGRMQKRPQKRPTPDAKTSQASGARGWQSVGTRSGTTKHTNHTKRTGGRIRQDPAESGRQCGASRAQLARVRLQHRCGRGRPHSGVINPAENGRMRQGAVNTEAFCVIEAADLPAESGRIRQAVRGRRAQLARVRLQHCCGRGRPPSGVINPAENGRMRQGAVNTEAFCVIEAADLPADPANPAGSAGPQGSIGPGSVTTLLRPRTAALRGHGRTQRLTTKHTNYRKSRRGGNRRESPEAKFFTEDRKGNEELRFVGLPVHAVHRVM